jgi:hypothetical protein
MSNTVTQPPSKTSNNYASFSGAITMMLQCYFSDGIPFCRGAARWRRRAAMDRE